MRRRKKVSESGLPQLKIKFILGNYKFGKIVAETGDNS
jgi:hypothetical protein